YYNPVITISAYNDLCPLLFSPILGKQIRRQLSHPAHFGPQKYCLRECICKVEGQVPCPAVVPLPRELTGKFQAALRAGAQD
ncbi:hypothetical protein FD754_018562, partial [Muntiacus muntjak]